MSRVSVLAAKATLLAWAPVVIAVVKTIIDIIIGSGGGGCDQ